jgi:hypothetical protein
MAVLGLDPRINPAISTRTALAKDAIPASENPVGMVRSNKDMTRWAAHANLSISMQAEVMRKRSCGWFPTFG